MRRGMIGLKLGLVAFAALTCVQTAQAVAPPPVTLDENCVVNILNRTIQVRPDGTWAMPNVPSSMGKIRARATCVQNGVTHSGQSNYFAVVKNGNVDAGTIMFGATDPVPASIAFQATSFVLSGVGSTLNLTATATYPDQSVKDVTAAASGINYSSSNPAIATVSVAGLVTAVSTGNVIITGRKDGALASASVRISAPGADADGDGMPDAYELANGLDPNDPVDAFEDRDNDGLTALQEYNTGTDPNLADTDGDGLSDGVEVSGSNGFVTNPLLADTDGDGLSDGLEIRVGSDPTNGASTNLAAALSSIQMTPLNLTIVFNTIDSEASRQLTVTGNLIDGNTIDLTSIGKGTTYASSDLTVANFSLQSGLVFAGQTGTADVTVTNNGFQAVAHVLVKTFTPHGISSITLPGEPQNVDASGDFAYVAAGSAGLQIVNVRNPNVPVIAGSFDTLGTAMDVKVNGAYAYIADGAGGLKIVDVTNPVAPVLTATVPMTGTAQDVAVLAGYVYVATGAGGLQIVDARVPAQASIVGSITGIGNVVGVDVQGTLAVIGVDMSVAAVDVSNPAAPVLLSRANVGLVEDVVIDGTLAHAAIGLSGYAAVDLTNPANIRALGGYSLVNGSGRAAHTMNMAVDGVHVFLAEEGHYWSMPYLNVADPTAPTYPGNIRVPNYPRSSGGISKSGSFLYVTDRTGLAVVQYKPLPDTAGLAPHVALTVPQAGSILVPGQQLTLAATASDDTGVVSVAFLINGNYIGASAASPYEIAYQIPATYLGGMTISAIAQDLGGNETRVDVPFQIVGNTPPTVQLTAPLLPVSYKEGDTIHIVAAASDAEGIAQVEFLVDGAVVGSDTTSPHAFDYHIPYNYPTGGTIHLAVRVTDTAGLTASSAPVSVVVNTNALPSAHISAVFPDIWTTGFQNSITVTATGRTLGNPGSRAELYVNGVLVYTNPYYYSWSKIFGLYFTPLTAGPISVYARVYDQAGNFVDTPTQVYQVNLAPTPANASLTIKLARLDGNATLSYSTVADGGSVIANSSLSLNVSVDNADKVNFYVNGQLVGTRFVYSVGHSSATYNYTLSTVGNAVITTESVAKDGRAVWSNPVNLVVVADQPPTVSITAPVSGNIIEGRTVPIQLQAIATDDYNVRWVSFLVNGQAMKTVYNDSTIGSQYSFKYQLPATFTAGTTLNIVARAYDSRIQNVWRYSESVPVVLHVVPDPMGTVSGRVLDRNGTPVSGALVTNDVGSPSVKSAADGTFSIALPTVKGVISLKAKAIVGGYLIEGRVPSLVPIAGSTITQKNIVLDKLSLKNSGLLKSAVRLNSVSSAFDSGGNLHILQLRTPSYNNSELVYRMLSPLGEVLIADSTIASWSGSFPYLAKPEIEIDGQNRVHAVWPEAVLYGKSEVWYTVIDPSLHPQDGTPAMLAITSVTPMMVSTGDGLISDHPAIAIDSYSNANIAWDDQIVDPYTGGLGSVRYVKVNGLTGAILIAEKTIAALDRFNYLGLGMTIDPLDRIHMVWGNTSLTYYAMLNSANGSLMVSPSAIRNNVNIWYHYHLAYSAGLLHLFRISNWNGGGDYIRLNPSLAAQDGTGVGLGQLDVASFPLVNAQGSGDIYTEPSGVSHLTWGGNYSGVFYQQWDANGIQKWDHPKDLGGKGNAENTEMAYDPLLKRLTVIWGEYEATTPPQYVLKTRSVQLNATGQLHGQLVDANGAPLANARLSVASEAASHVLTTDTLGNFNDNAIDLSFGSNAALYAITGNGSGRPLTATYSTVLLPGQSKLTQPVAFPIPVQTASFLPTGNKNFSAGWNAEFTAFPEGFYFPFFGKLYSGAYIDTKGRLNFGFASRLWQPGLQTLLEQAQIDVFHGVLDWFGNSPFKYNDSVPGQVTFSWLGLEDAQLDAYGDFANYFQVTLYNTGQIKMSYSLMDSWYIAATVGLSAGKAVPAEILATDLSLPVIGSNHRVLYQSFPQNSFDIRYSSIIFTPNILGGYDSQVLPMTALPPVP